MVNLPSLNESQVTPVGTQPWFSSKWNLTDEALALFRFSNCIVLSVCHILNESLDKNPGPQDQRVDICNGGGVSCRTASIKPLREDTDENIDGKRQFLRFLSTLERVRESATDADIYWTGTHDMHKATWSVHYSFINSIDLWSSLRSDRERKLSWI